MPPKRTRTPPAPTITTRRRPDFPTFTSPARPEAASMPVAATVAIAAAKIRSSHGEGAEGQDDQVVEDDRPARDEAPELVEGVAGEGRGAAALRVEGVALHVGEHRDHEEQAGQDEDERGQPERVAGHDPERVVER